MDGSGSNANSGCRSAALATARGACLYVTSNGLGASSFHADQCAHGATLALDDTAETVKH